MFDIYVYAMKDVVQAVITVGGTGALMIVPLAIARLIDRSKFSD